MAGAGTFTLDPTGTTGAYRQATGGGTFTLEADVGPGADSPWHVVTDGDISVLQPELRMSVIRTSWGGLGVDYVTRRVTVTYLVENIGPGDSFGARVVSTTSSTNGVTPLGPTPQALGDIPKDGSKIFSVRYQLGLLAPCRLVILSCNFVTTVGVEMPDALDVVAAAQSKNLAVQAPALPPPLSP